jgi:hypothetical protein
LMPCKYGTNAAGSMTDSPLGFDIFGFSTCSLQLQPKRKELTGRKTQHFNQDILPWQARTALW